ncbi:ABC transporter permease [Diplocloster hominis]|uniref:ABC transporter permease n=1 Tax=Diplocloster hominis TaxID=3079010 RepID=UPI0031BA8E57
MNISLRKWKALFKKDLCDYLKNPAMFICNLIPLMFVVLYNFLPLDISGDKSIFLLAIGMLLNSCMCAIVVPSTSIAEEKEKFTLRTLILSNVSAAEFFLSKICMGIVITMAGNLLVFLLSKTELVYLPAYLLFTFLGTLCLVMLSAVIGSVCRDQMSTSILQVPLMLILLIPSMFSGAFKLFRYISYISPIDASLQLYYNAVKGELFSGKSAVRLCIIVVWVIGGSLLFRFIYKKRGFDN